MLKVSLFVPVHTITFHHDSNLWDLYFADKKQVLPYLLVEVSHTASRLQHSGQQL